MQLKRVGVGKLLSQLKRDCREFDQYMVVNYDYETLKEMAIRRPLGKLLVEMGYISYDDYMDALS